MKAYIIIPHGFDCTILCGNVDFQKVSSAPGMVGEVILYKTIDEARSSEFFDHKTQYIAKIQFIDEDQIRAAVMAAYMGNRCSKFKIALIETISFHNTEAA